MSSKEHYKGEFAKGTETSKFSMQSGTEASDPMSSGNGIEGNSRHSKQVLQWGERDGDQDAIGQSMAITGKKEIQ